MVKNKNKLKGNKTKTKPYVIACECRISPLIAEKIYTCINNRQRYVKS